MLEGLYAGSIADAELREAQNPIKDIEASALSAAAPLDVLDWLRPADRIKVIAEVKRASPSRGDLATISDPALLAEIYASNGASAISVLTEGHRFKGSLADLDAVRERVKVPVLRKDFIANEYQIFEGRAHGADIILLIVAGLNQKTIERLKKLTEELGMTAFIETHSSDEVKRALDIDAKLLGVNARDLSTFETDRNLFGTLANEIPNGIIKVAESAVRNAEDVEHYRRAGADVVLVGEALVTNDPAAMLKSFLSAGSI